MGLAYKWRPGRRGGRSWEKFSGKRSSGPKPPQTVPTEKISSRSDLLVSILRSAELGSPIKIAPIDVTPVPSDTESRRLWDSAGSRPGWGS